ncbi:MAG: lysophospholipid acyltransferase family protein [Bacteroidota bacterium]
MKQLRGILRLIGFALVTGFLATKALIRLRLNRGELSAIRGEFTLWAKLSLRILGIHLEMKGSVPEEEVLFLPNHRSYIDIACFPLYKLVVFVAKIEVNRWPLIGYASRVVQTVFVDRQDPESRKNTRETMKARLVQGYSVVVFPEGTTAQAPEIKEFRPGMFFVAAEGDIPVVPVAIEYAEPSDAFIGDDTFVPHFLRTFGKPKTLVKISLGPVMRHAEGERLRQEVSNWVRRETAEIREGFLQSQPC